jgi:hypothetical protein
MESQKNETFFFFPVVKVKFPIGLCLSRTSHQFFDVGFPDRRRFGARRRREERDDRLCVDVLEHAEQLRVAAAHGGQPQRNGEEKPNKREIQKDHL